jgi:PAT family beta-lactamase induction signal transducer AmpG
MYSFKNIKPYLFNKRLFFILILGFSSGLPLALTSSTLQAWYTVSGVNILTIGFLGFVGQPYVYKFLWAPLMDRFEIPVLGRRRGWMFITQTSLLLTIVGMSFVEPARHPYFLGGLGLLAAFFSASQDINIDAYRTDLLKPEERGMGAAVAVTGYRIAMLVSGGFALVLAAEIGWHYTYMLMGCLMLAGMISSLTAPDPTYVADAPESIIKAALDPLRDLFNRESGLIILVFIIIYKLSYEFILTMTPTFLLRDLGFTLIQVGTINKGIGFAALLLGIFCGGILLIRMGILRALFIFGSLQAVGNLGYMCLALVGKDLTLLISVISAENFFAGMEASAFVAFLMSLCNHKYTAMQFALFSALATVGRVIAGPIGALIVMHSNWAHLYFWSFVIALPALTLLWTQRRKFERVLV